MATQDLGQVVGKSAYEYAVDGGYAGTEAEFKALMADAATKSYVDTLFNQVAPVIVKVQLIDSTVSVYKSYNVKCYPTAEYLSYSINMTFKHTGRSISKIKIIPPEQYAFTGLDNSSGIKIESQGIAQEGIIQNDGTVLMMYISDSVSSYDWSIIGKFTLEVA